MHYSKNATSTWNNGFLELLVLTCVQLLSTYEQNGSFSSKSLFESSSLVYLLVLSVGHIDIREQEQVYSK